MKSNLLLLSLASLFSKTFGQQCELADSDLLPPAECQGVEDDYQSDIEYVDGISNADLDYR